MFVSSLCTAIILLVAFIGYLTINGSEVVEQGIAFAQSCITPTTTATRTLVTTTTPTATSTLVVGTPTPITFTFNGSGEQSINGALTASDARSDNNRGHNYYQDTYTLVMNQPGEIAISVVSAIDTDLYYMYSNGNHWNEQSMYHNGDCAGTFNPRLPCPQYGGEQYYSQTAGTFLIEVTSYAPLVTGAYTLTVEVE